MIKKITLLLLGLFSFLFAFFVSFDTHAVFRSHSNCTYVSIVTGGSTVYLNRVTCNNVYTGGLSGPIGPFNNVDLGDVTMSGMFTTMTTTGYRYVQSSEGVYHLGNCWISSSNVAARVFTGLNCPTGYLIRGIQGMTGATGLQGMTGATGNIVLTISGYNLTNISGSSTSGSSTIVNNVVDYAELTKSSTTSLAIAGVIIIVLLIVTYLFRGLFVKLFFSGKK